MNVRPGRRPTRGSTLRRAATSAALCLAVSTIAPLAAPGMADAQITREPPPPGTGEARLVPASGPSAGGTTVRIAGAGFDRLHLVRFGSAPACIVAVDETGITVVSPAHRPGLARVSIDHPVWGAADSVVYEPYRYVRSPASPPAVERLITASGPAAGGTDVAIAGRGFCRHTGLAVRFGDRQAPQVEVVSDTQLIAVSPPHEGGVVPVTVRAGGTVSRPTPATAYRYSAGGASPSPAGGPSRSTPPGRRGAGWTMCGRATAGPGCPGSMSAPRFLHAVVTLDLPSCRLGRAPAGYPCGQVLVAGGHQMFCSGVCGEPVLDFVELFDPTTGRWRRTAPLPSPRGEFTATLLEDGRVLAVGGQGRGSENILGRADLYDPVRETWVPAAPLGRARFAHTATRLDGPACDDPTRAPWCGKVLVVGGTTQEVGRPALGGAELFDPATGEWSATDGMASVRSNHTATLLPNGYVLVAGGLTKADRPLPSPDPALPAPGGKAAPGASTVANASAEVFHPATGSWRPVGPLAIARFAHTATLLGDGRVLVVGGIDSGEESRPLASAELYDPASGAWSPTRIPGAARAAHVAAPLDDGRVLVAGGGSPFAGLYSPSEASVEVYDPAEASWEAAGSLHYPRAGAVATVLGGPRCRDSGGAPWCGKVMLIGGGFGVVGDDPGLGYLSGPHRRAVTSSALGFDPLALATSELWMCESGTCSGGPAGRGAGTPALLVGVIAVTGSILVLAAWFAVSRGHRPRRPPRSAKRAASMPSAAGAGPRRPGRPTAGDG